MSDQPRYFCNVNGFQDGTKFMRVDPDGRVFGVAQDGREWVAWSYPIDSILEKVTAGIWEELPAPAAALVERATPEEEFAEPVYCASCAQPILDLGDVRCVDCASSAVADRATAPASLDIDAIMDQIRAELSKGDGQWAAVRDEVVQRVEAALRAALRSGPSRREPQETGK